MKLHCSRCQAAYPPDTHHWTCTCGGPFLLEGTPPFRQDLIRPNLFTLWRYRAMLPIERDESIVSLGEGFTPMVETEIYGLPILCKLEYLAPTGSFKDRGTTVLVSKLREMGINKVVEDSSGNAGASLAAYCARAGIQAEIYTPAHASPAKLAQLGIYGAKLTTVNGPRERAAEAVAEAARHTYYASHYWNPFGLEGLKTFAYEVCEQLGWRAPHNIIFPVGHGTLLLGTYRGFRELLEVGLVNRPPRLIAAQISPCAPIQAAFVQNLKSAPAIETSSTVAEGISIAHPVRSAEVLEAIRETGGTAITVGDEEALDTRDRLARKGLYVEPTSAVAVAALRQLHDLIEASQITVIPLTGSGLKSHTHQPS
ncbi:MAG: threonine synthase [Anaerolineae bacterium]